MDTSSLLCRKGSRHRARMRPALNISRDGTDQSFDTLCRDVRSSHLTTPPLRHPLHQEYPEFPAISRSGRFPSFAIECVRESLGLAEDCYPFVSPVKFIASGGRVAGWH